MWPNAPELLPEKHYGERIVRCYADRPRSVDALLTRAAAEAADVPALIDTERGLTYGELNAAADAVAGALTDRGVQAGDRVALLLDNRAEFAEAFFGVVRAGAIAVPLNVREQRPALEYLIGHAGAKVVIHEAHLSTRLPPVSVTPAVQHRITVGAKVEGSEPFENLLSGSRRATCGLEEDAVATILYTSGTTGKPKGAMLTHLSIITSTMNYEVCWGLSGADTALMAVPASHVTGLVAILLSMVRVKGATVMLRDFKARRFLELASAKRMTYTILVPAMYNLCLRQSSFGSFDLRTWRVGGYGGAPMPPAVIAELSAKMPWLQLVNAYGATETTSPTTLMPPGDGMQHAATVGRPVPTAVVVIRDAEGQPLSVGQIGDIWIGGSQLAAGYWCDDAATQESFQAGLWNSGDVGAMTGDGYLRLMDRKKDLINRGGYKVYSVEVESTLMECPGVAEVALIPVSDPVLGEKSHAVVYSKIKTLTESEVKRFCAERLSDYKVPDYVSFVDQPLARNAAGKVLKKELASVVKPGLLDYPKDDC